jgi:hypothetical protein
MKNATWTWIIIGLVAVGGYYAYQASQTPKG